MKSDSKNKWLLSYLLLGITWGLSFLFIKQGLEFLTPLGVAFGRCSLGALTLIIIAKVKGVELPRDPKIWGHLLVVALLLNVFPGILFALAETKVTSILAGIINAVTPLMTVLAILIIGRDEKPKRAQLVGLALGFVGVATVMGVWQGLGDNPILYVGMLLLAVTCYGFSFPYSRRFVMPYILEPTPMATVQLICASAVLLPGYLYDGIAQDEFKLIPVLSMLALGIFGSGVAYIWNFEIIRAAGSAIASSVTFVTPVVAVIAGIIFLGESITWYEPVGALIVLFGAAVAQERIKLFSRA
ncbi:MAG: DMT family transporter [Candidatus Nanopelagicaceae bacterium]